MQCRTAIAALATLCALALPAPLAVPLAAQPQDTLRIRLNADIRSTDPGVNRDANTDGIAWHVVEGLVALRDDATVAPMLAERVDVSADGLTYTFPLRAGIRFHNGQPLTSADVAFAMQRYMRREVNWRCRGDLDSAVTRLVAVETPDDRTVVMRLEKPSALFLTILARPDCGQAGIWHRDSLNADGSLARADRHGPFAWANGARAVRGTDGALRLRALPGEPTGLGGNKTPMVERVRFTIIPDEAAARAALLAGNIDVLPDARSRDLPDIRARPGFTVHSSPSMDLQAVLMQTRDPLLQDVRMRRAIALSIDVPELVRAVSEGGSRPSRSPSPPPPPFNTPRCWKCRRGIWRRRGVWRRRPAIAASGCASSPRAATRPSTRSRSWCRTC